MGRGILNSATGSSSLFMWTLAEAMMVQTVDSVHLEDLVWVPGSQLGLLEPLRVCEIEPIDAAPSLLRLHFLPLPPSLFLKWIIKHFVNFYFNECSSSLYGRL